MTTNPEKHARPNHPLLEVLARRWSPYVFEPRPVEREKLLSCLEAARWAASSYNEQPWSFIVAPRDEEPEFQQLLGCLVEANQAWARDAGVLLLTVAARTFRRNDRPNRVAAHDVGLAMGNFTVQATELGLAVHQMAGVDLEKARQTYQIPASHDPLTAVALGYAAPPDASADPQLAQRDTAPRSRKPLSEFVFAGRWNQPAKWA